MHKCDCRITGQLMETQSEYSVSDNQLALAEVEGKNVYHISKLTTDKSNVGFMLAVQPVNLEVIKVNLKNTRPSYIN